MATKALDQEHFGLKRSSGSFSAVLLSLEEPQPSIDLLGTFFSDIGLPCFKTKLFVHNPEAHYSTLELYVTVRWDAGGRRPEEEVMRIRMTAANTGAITCRQVSEATEVPATVRELFYNAASFEDKVNRGEISTLDVDYTATPLLASGVYSKALKTYGGQAGNVESLRTTFREAHKLRFYVLGGAINNSIDALTHRFEEERNRSFLSFWYPNHPNKIFIQVGDYPDLQDRPKPSLGAKPAFDSKEEYLTLLGFAAIQEHEYTKNLQEAVSDRHLPIRMMTIPGCGDRQYIAFLEKPEGSKFRLVAGDRLTINFNEEVDSREDDWPGFVIDLLPFAPMNNVCVIVTRPYNKDVREFRKDVGTFAAIDGTNLKRDVDVRNAVMQATPVPVGVRVKTSDKDMKRQVSSLRSLQDIDAADTWDLLLGNDYGSLPRRNLFRNVNATSQQLQNVIACGHFNQKQYDAADMTLNAPAGMVYVQGPAGTGKTHFLCYLALPFLAFPSRATKQPGKTHNQVLLTACVNDPVDDMGRRMQEVAALHITERKPIIVRYHAYETEEDIMKQPAGNKRGRPEDARPALFKDEEAQLLDEMAASQMVKNLYAEATAGAHGIVDKRVKQISLALGTWMLKFTGYIEEPRISAPNDFAHFRTLYDNYHNSGEMTREDKIALKAETKALRNYVLQQADVVVTSISNCADNAIRMNVKPEFIAIDEAGKATEPNIWHVLVGYKASGIVQVGDQRQTKPLVLSAPKIDGTGNCLAPLLSVSNLTRAVQNGFESVMFEEQDRMVPDIANLVSTAFYEQKLQHGKSTNIRPLSDQFKSFTAEQFGKGSALLLFNTHKSKQERDSNQSSYNIVQAVLGLSLLEKLLAAKFKPTDIMIVTPYAAQGKLYVTGITRMQELKPQEDLRGIRIKTIDRSQGLESPIVIFDLVITEGLGFIDMGRLCVGETRARDGMYMILNMHAMEQLSSKRTRVIKSTIEYIKQNRLSYKPEQTRESAYL